MGVHLYATCQGCLAMMKPLSFHFSRPVPQCFTLLIYNFGLLRVRQLAELWPFQDHQDLFFIVAALQSLSTVFSTLTRTQTSRRAQLVKTVCTLQFLRNWLLWTSTSLSALPLYTHGAKEIGRDETVRQEIEVLTSRKCA